MLLLEYVWIDGVNKLRSKTRCIEDININVNIKNIPEWNYDGSSTYQASCEKSEVVLSPCAIFKDPFRRNTNSYIVLCSTYTVEGKPLSNNHRHKASKLFNNEEDPWFGLEQEYFICNELTGYPLGYTPDIIQGQYYCSVGTNNTFGRKIVEEHLEACLYAGIKISGINAEVAPGQWEFQIGICKGIEAGDHLWVARYLLERIAENNGVVIDYHPKPKHNINGSGCHTNFSTRKMRTPGIGMEEINRVISLLGEKHEEHIKIYGKYNNLRLIGTSETSSMKHFSYGIGDRSVSVRIGNETVKNGYGYIEDRRPASNIDPYLVTSKIFETCCL